MGFSGRVSGKLDVIAEGRRKKEEGRRKKVWAINNVLTVLAVAITTLKKLS
jgi:hypothetical protein